MIYFVREILLLIAFTVVFTHSVMAQASNDFVKCLDKFPFNEEVKSNVTNTQHLCYKSFAVLYSQENKTPIFSVEKLTKSSVEASWLQRRDGHFYVDKAIPSWYSSSPKDYFNSGFDKGHATPASDMGEPEPMAESFVLTNVFPQWHSVNTGVWKRLENSISKFAYTNGGDTVVFTGTIYSVSPHLMVGSVSVPDMMYKLVYNTNQKCSRVYVIMNNSGGGQVKMSAKELSTATGVSFNDKLSTMCKY